MPIRNDIEEELARVWLFPVHDDEQQNYNMIRAAQGGSMLFRLASQSPNFNYFIGELYEDENGN